MHSDYMKDLQHITIQIADQPPIDLNIKRDTEEMVRKTEKSINKVWATWCNDFKQKSSTEVLAMVTYQYAKLYYELLAKIEANEKTVADFEKKLDTLLLNMK